MITIKKFETYLTMVRNSVGTNMFRTLLADVDGETQDITKNGDLSCAVFVTSVLYLFGAIGGVHARTESSVKDMLNSGWLPTKSPRFGAVIVWKPYLSRDGQRTPHIGFFIDESTAISNSSKEGFPVAHHITYGGTREIEEIYWNEQFSKQ